MNKFEKNQNHEKHNFSTHAVFYSISGALIIVYLFGLFYFEQLTTANNIRHTAYIGFCAGFLIWMYPTISEKNILDSYLSKLIFIVLNAILVTVSIVPARYLVADSLNLPPQDFDLTVAVLSLLFYLTLLCAVISIASLILAIPIIFAWLFKFSPIYFIYSLMRRNRNPSITMTNADMIFMGHCIGALLLIYWLAQVPILVFSNFSNLEPAVRQVAYYSDYFPVDSVPCTVKNRKPKALLHSNGVISYASNDRKSGVVIDEVRISESACPLKQ